MVQMSGTVAKSEAAERLSVWPPHPYETGMVLSGLSSNSGGLSGWVAAADSAPGGRAGFRLKKVIRLCKLAVGG